MTHPELLLVKTPFAEKSGRYPRHADLQVLLNVAATVLRKSARFGLHCSTCLYAYIYIYICIALCNIVSLYILFI